ncbi:MAG: DinB family protein, partial [Gemmatimonadales bacterium]
VDSEHRTLGRIAWHITGTIREMMEKTGLHVEGPAENAPVPPSAKTISQTYAKSSESLLGAISKQWTDASLAQKDSMYGEEWTRANTLQVLVLHQVHHRGQATVLMRQAGLRVPGVYGPAKEDWAQWQMQPPAI